MRGPSSPDNAKRKEKPKQAAAWCARVVWIIAGIYLFATTPEESFFSVKAILFFFVGTFAASVAIGSATNLVGRAIASLVKRVVRSPGAKAAAFVSTIGQILLIAEACIVYLAARLAFNTMGR
jgi:hypothetical protein